MKVIHLLRWSAVSLFITYSVLSAQPATPIAKPVLSPAEISIQRAREAISKKPNHAPYYNSLAMALARRARETSDVSFYAEAEETLKRSFAIAPDGFETRKVEVWILLGRHEFQKALDAAKDLNRKMPDDITVYGYLTDANAELGNYDAALNSAQWMLNLRAGNIAGLTRGAYLRELFGDTTGAIELMQMAYDATATREAEDRAWILTQISHLRMLKGDLKQAESYANGALGLFANYHYALGALAQVRVAQERYEEAAALLQKRFDAAPHAENLYALAEALEMAGQHDAAAKAYAQFETKALRESTLADNANHELIAYYVDHAGKPDDGLRLAARELARRQDIHTIDCYAWALAANGRYGEANSEIQKALHVGKHDAKILYHAGAIALHLGKMADADKYLKDAALRYSPEAAKLMDARSRQMEIANP